ncbi:hypothetical protein D6D17_09502, partial [Aureobasidium pullulans]
MSDPKQYTVGWICALSTESVAACLFLDKEHEDRPDHLSPNDSNDYTLGEMSGHYVVIAVMPEGEYGQTSATGVIKDMLNSFPNIRIGLMVGIGGGAPSAKHDIRLGDVVVSSPQDGTGGVYQYDYGKLIQGQGFQHTGFLNQPSTLIRTTVSGLKTQYKRKGHKIQETIKTILDDNPRLNEEFSHPGEDKDRLYRSDVVHAAACGEACEDWCGIQPVQIVERRKRTAKEDSPAIHHGVVASGSSLMKDATIRDALAKEKSVMCFEMEAAGLMNHFPCLVVRGICDYSDSHKNKQWQGYAAMTAAAYAKDLLTRMVPSRVEQEDKIERILYECKWHKALAGQNVVNDGFKDLCRESKTSTDVLKAHAHSTREHLEKEAVRYVNIEHQNCHQVFKTSTYEQFKNINPDRVEQTCQWALSHTLYQHWRDSASDDLLWISADPGCGKSVLSRALVDKDLRRDISDVTICYFFFKDNDEQNSLATGLCALLHQLFQHQPHLLQHAVSAWNKNGSKLQQETDELWRILLTATSDPAARNTICVLDALDECRDRDRSDLIAKLARFHKDAASQGPRQSWLKFIVTSRPYDDIQRGFDQIPPSLPAIRLRGEQQNDQIRAEINRVINVRVSHLATELGLRESTSSRLKQSLLAMEHRTYLWLHLAIEDVRTTLRHSFKPDEEAIESVPLSVEGAYEKILARVTPAQHQKVKLILQIIVGARRPLSVDEMALALGLATSKQCRTSMDAQVDPNHLGKQLRHWCGLFVFVVQSRIYLIHQTAREFLVARQEYQHRNSFAHSTWKHCVQKAEMEQVMARICMRCINLEDREILTDDHISTLSQRGGDRNENFIDYCCEWWTTHYSLSPDEGKEDTLQDALALYNIEGEAFKFWFDRFWFKTRPYDRARSMTSIQLAAISNHDRVLEHYLAKPGTDVEAKDEEGRSALYWASELGHEKIARMLLEKGADVNAQGEWYGNALQAASVGGHDKTVQLLLDKGADVNAEGGQYGNALQAASAEGHDEIVQLLLDKGTDVNAQGGRYGNALQAASVEGHNKTVQLLLDKGADVNAQ